MPELKYVLVVFVSWACVFVAGGCSALSAAGGSVRCDFESNPLERGWHGVRRNYRPFEGAVTEAPDRTGQKCLVIRKGGWESPPIRTNADRIYRLGFDARTEKAGFWRVFFYDGSGREHHADNYSRLYATGGQWHRQECFFEVREGTEFMKAGFDPLSEEPLYLDDIELRPADRGEVLAWIDRIREEIPSVNYAPPADRWEPLTATRQALRDGGKLRVVMLGDSIANDTANSLFHLRLERMYAGAKLDLVRSVRSGTGCTYYREGDRVREYVLRYEPDLLIIGGISHNNNAGAIREVIRKVREESDPEILVLSGAISQFLPHHVWREGKKILNTREQQLERNRKFREDLAAMCEEEDVAYMDMRGAWAEYLESAEKDGDWFRRDPTHGNSRGKQAVGEMLVRFLSPPDEGL